MSKSFKAFGLAVSALALTQLPAAAQTKITTEIQDELKKQLGGDLQGLLGIGPKPQQPGASPAPAEPAPPPARRIRRRHATRGN